MEKIPIVVPAQAYEIARDLIAGILTTELANQHQLDSKVPKVGVWANRVIGFDRTELPAVNIAVSRANYSNKDRLSIDGEYLFHIDFYLRNTEHRSPLFCRDRVVGIIRYILEDPRYKTFGIKPPFVRSSMVRDIDFIDNSDNGDSDSVCGARIVFSALLVERQQGITPINIAEAITGVNIEDTDKGYKYVWKDQKV